MADPFYTRLQATANRLITKFGQTGTVTRLTPPHPIDGGEHVEAAYPAVLVPMAYDARFIDGTVIKSSDVQLYISAVGLPIVPGPGDVATANGATYTIVNADPNLYDGVTPVVYIVQARR